MNHVLKSAVSSALLLAVLLTFAGCGTTTLDQGSSASSVPAESAAQNAGTAPADSDGHQEPVNPEDVQIDESKAGTCYLTISCATIRDNMGNLTEGKESLVPEDGVLVPRTAVTYYEGESVFDVLLRETKNRKMHMSFRTTPMYNSAYIEAIGNLYEMDCGPASGWMYSVNDWFPNYGVSRYMIQENDEIVFAYTCDLGRDLGTDWVDQQ